MIARIEGQGCTIDVEGADVKELLRNMSGVQEIMGKRKCGMCGGESLFFNVRSAQGFEFFELKCRDCNGALAFGQKRDGGGLFPKSWARYSAPGGEENGF